MSELKVTISIDASEAIEAIRKVTQELEKINKSVLEISTVINVKPDIQFDIDAVSERISKMLINRTSFSRQP
jgi:hypothetical protein